MEKDLLLDECEATRQGNSLLLNFPKIVRAITDMKNGDRIIFVMDRKAMINDHPVRLYFKKEGTTLEGERIVGSAVLWLRGATTVFTIPRGLKIMLCVKPGTALTYVVDKFLTNKGDPVRVYLKRCATSLYD